MKIKQGIYISIVNGQSDNNKLWRYTQKVKVIEDKEKKTIIIVSVS